MGLGVRETAEGELSGWILARILLDHHLWRLRQSSEPQWKCIIIRQAFREEMKQFAAERNIPIVTFKKQDKKEEVAKEYLEQFEGQSGVVLIGKAQ